MLDRVVASALMAIRRHDEGATMPEYALIVAVVAIFLIVGAAAMATDVGQKFVDIGQQILDA